MTYSRFTHLIWITGLLHRAHNQCVCVRKGVKVLVCVLVGGRVVKGDVCVIVNLICVVSVCACVFVCVCVYMGRPPRNQRKILSHLLCALILNDVRLYICWSVCVFTWYEVLCKIYMRTLHNLIGCSVSVILALHNENTISFNWIQPNLN